ncbi:MAG: hypothetical protein H6515_14505 [Microthrixaceae bacterium]|nr:hypothetical protein [Microthrixaceae bacterium]
MARPIITCPTTDETRRLVEVAWNETHCPKGHPYDAENTRIEHGRHRRCRTCWREHCRQYRQKVAVRPRPLTPGGEEA